MSAPLLSLCIPTFNRSRYLALLLTSLEDHFADFPYPYEIVLADNASPDATREVVEHFAPRLPIRYHRHAENIGGTANYQFVLAQALGRYVVYVADDDSLLADALARAIARMEADPGIAVVYAPWVLFDLVAQQNEGLFFQVPRDLHIRRGQHRELLDHVLRHEIFPEIHIARREVLQRVMPRVNDQAFYAFVHAADFLAQGDLLIQQQPFYVSITRYFADEERAQAGHQEAEEAWDRYRGGLEYVLARVPEVTAPERLQWLARIQGMVAVRMKVAIRLRFARERDPVDSYLLATRLRGMGYEELLPVPMPVLATQAALAFAMRDGELLRGAQAIHCVGDFDAELRAFLQRHAALPLSFVPDVAALAGVRDVFVFARNGSGLASGRDAERGLRVLSERDLVARFPA